MSNQQLQTFARADEGAHQPSTDESWQESVLLCWFDDRSGIGGSHRIGQEVNRGSANAWCGVMTDEGQRFRSNPLDLPLQTSDRGSTHLRAGDYGFEFGETGGTYVVHTADCEMELEFTDFYEPLGAWDQREESKVGNELGVSNHFEAAGRISGHARLGERHFDVDGLCQRGHSWGPLDWSRSAGTRWCSGTCGPSLSFTGIIAQDLDYNVLKGGMVMRDGLLTVADDIDFCVLLEPDGMSIRGGMATWFLRDGTTLELTCEPIDGVVFNIHERIGEVDSICRVSDGHDNVGFCNLLVWNGLHRIAPVLSSFGANIDEGLSHRGRKQPRPWPTRWTAGGGHV